MSLRKERPGDAGRAPPCECDFLTQRQLRNPRTKLLLRVALELRRNAGQKRELYQVHQVQFTNQTQTRKARCARVKSQSAFHAVIPEQWLAASHLLQTLRG